MPTSFSGLELLRGHRCRRDDHGQFVFRAGSGPASGTQCPSKHFRFPAYWPLGQQTSGLIQVHDLVAPLDFEMSAGYLQRLGAIVCALLANRDNNRGFPEDPFRGGVMAAWGAYTDYQGCNWWTDVDTSGLFVYAMAAFARRVADRPDRYTEDLRVEAVAMITAAIETYWAFRPWLYLDDGDPHAYWSQPENSKDAGEPIPYNQNLSMVKALSELAPAADSNLYRASADATPTYLQLATEEMPLVVAKNIAYRVADLHPRTLSDGTPYYEWDYKGSSGVDDIHHAQFELGCLAVVLEGQLRLNELLERAGRSERVPLAPSTFERLANTFLRIVWHDNRLAGKHRRIRGPGLHRRVRRVGTAGAVRSLGVDARPRHHVQRIVTWPPRGQPWGAAAVSKVQFHEVPDRLRGPELADHPGGPRRRRAAPQSIRDQKWLLILSGVVLANQRGDNSGSWNHQTVSFIPDMAGPDDPTATSGPLNWAIARYGIPRPAGTGRPAVSRPLLGGRMVALRLAGLGLRPGTFG